jgi:hypothetical protein
MKKYLLSSVLLFSLFLGMSQTQGASDYKEILKNTFDRFDSTTNFNQKMALDNQLNLIAAKWKDVWLTHYYAGYARAIISSLEKDDDKRDADLDEADKEQKLAVALLGKENDETHILSALIANWRIAISPMIRSGTYAQIFRENLLKASQINPVNPRIYYLQGAAKFAMPKFVGGGKDAALPYLSKADSLFKKENALDIAKPYWGKKLNAFYLQQCLIQ